MDTPVPTYHVLGSLMSDRTYRARPGRRPRVQDGYRHGVEYYKEGVWSVNVQRVGVWALACVQHSYAWSQVRVFVEPWDVWQSSSPLVRRNLLVSFLRKHQADQSSSNAPPSVDQAFQQQYPALSEYLTSPLYPDGSARQLSTMTVFREDGWWKACLNEKDQGLVLFVAESQFGTLLEALELLLQEDHPPWRKSTVKRGSGRGKGGGGT